MGINWNTVPAFYNDSYTYMEWLGKVTAKVEDHEKRITEAEADIDQLQEDVDGIKTTLEDHEQRLTQAENDIDAMEDDVSTLTTWYEEYAQDAVEYVVQNKNNISTAINISIPALQEQTAENTAAILSIQREGTTIYCDVSEVTEVVDITSIQTTYATLTPSETAVDVVYRISCTINSNTEAFVIRELIHVGDTLNGISFNADGYITYSVEIEEAGSIEITLGSSNISGQAYADTDITATTVSQADIILYAGKAPTPPTEDKEEFQASVKIFTDKTIPIDARTTSIILQYYSAASTDPDLTWADWAAEYNAEHPTGLQVDATAYPDTNKDGKINAIDASNILTYYSNASTGKTQYLNSDADKFYNWYLDGNPPIWEY